MRFGKRPFLITIVVILLLMIGLVWLAPVGMLTAVSPIFSVNKATSNTKLLESSDIEFGRTDILFHISAQEQGVLSVQQYAHYYFAEDTAVSNFNQHTTTQPEWLATATDSFVILPAAIENVQQIMWCGHLENGQLMCEYRAQQGHWTIHTDFVSRDTAIYDQTFFTELREHYFR